MTTDYRLLITSEHRKKPKFAAAVGLSTDSFAQLSQMATGLYALFDLDNAIGQQLDFVGEWLGISRNLYIPSGLYFSFDDPDLGFDAGIWYTGYDGTQVSVTLSDADFRYYIRGLVAAASWDGRSTTLPAVILAALPSDYAVQVYDGHRMNVGITVTGPTLTPNQKSMIRYGVGPFVRGAGINHHYSWIATARNLLLLEDGSHILLESSTDRLALQSFQS